MFGLVYLDGLADESDRSVRMAHRNSCLVNEHFYLVYLDE